MVIGCVFFWSRSNWTQLNVARRLCGLDVGTHSHRWKALHGAGPANLKKVSINVAISSTCADRLLLHHNRDGCFHRG